MNRFSVLALVACLLGLSARPLSAQSTMFTLRGVDYITNLRIYTSDLEPLRARSPWQFGETEPPIGPNAAAQMAQAAFDAQFGDQVNARLQFVALNNMVVQGEAFPHWRVIFVELPTEEEMDARRNENGMIKIANISYLVFMNGDLIAPEEYAP